MRILCESVDKAGISPLDLCGICILQKGKRGGGDRFENRGHAFEDLRHPSVCQGCRDQPGDLPVPDIRIIVEELQRVRMYVFPAVVPCIDLFEILPELFRSFPDANPGNSRSSDPRPPR